MRRSLRRRITKTKTMTTATTSEGTRTVTRLEAELEALWGFSASWDRISCGRWLSSTTYGHDGGWLPAAVSIEQQKTDADQSQASREINENKREERREIGVEKWEGQK